MTFWSLDVRATESYSHLGDRTPPRLSVFSRFSVWLYLLSLSDSSLTLSLKPSLVEKFEQKNQEIMGKLYLFVLF